jgi:hypothetical protein
MRIHDWLPRLITVFEGAHGRRFRWGTHDCCQFAARCVVAVTGEEKRRMFPRYRTRAEAELIIADCGGMRGLLTRALGEPVHPSRARQGDIVLLDIGRGEQPAVCMGAMSYAPGPRKLEFSETLTSSAAWML